MTLSNRYAFGDFVLERAQRRLLRRDGTPVGLTPRLFSALLLFVERAGEVLDKDTLMRTLWPGLVVEENNLSQVVSALRRALGDDTQGRFIQTVPRRGFVFVGEVAAVPDEPIPMPALAPATLPATDDPAQAPSLSVAVDASPPASSQTIVAGRRRWLSAAMAAAAGLGGLGWWAARQLGQARDALPATLAVLPFRPLTSEGRDELLELGMADSLAARLSTVPGLVVRSTSSVLRFAGPTQDPQRAAGELDVGWIVDGTLQRRGNQLRVTARLLRADSGAATWSGSFDEEFSNVFSVQDQISSRVTRALAPALQASVADIGGQGELGGTRSTEAYQLYLAAAWRAQGTRADSTAKALALLRQALMIDPDYALAWTLTAWTHRRTLWRNDGVPGEVFPAAQTALERAQALAPELAQARAGQGFGLSWFHFDWSGAEREFRAALKSNANETSAQWGLAQLLLMQGRLDEGFGHMRMARELDPMSPVLNTLEACYLARSGRVAEGRKRLDRAFDIAPEHGLAYEALALLCTIEGQPAQAIAAQRLSVKHSDGSSRPRAKLASLLAKQGETAEARAIFEQMRGVAKARYVPPSALAMVHAALGEPDAALDALEQALQVRDTWLVYLRVDPGWDGLRQEPRFVALSNALKLDGYDRSGLMPI